MSELHTLQAANGAIFSPLSAEIEGVISFNNDQQALNSVQTGVAIYDRSHWGRLLISDTDSIRFLHNQSTNNFNVLKPGESCDTVFVTSTARTIDLVTAYVTEIGVLLLGSPSCRFSLLKWLDRYLFPMDQVKITDLTESTKTLTLIGPESHNLLAKFGLNLAEDLREGTHQLMTDQKGMIGEVRVAKGSGLARPGYTLICDKNVAPSLWENLVKEGAIPLGERVWEQLRITQGRPAPDRELTEDYNPLEARLLHTISYEKGCYIGQETIARLNTYKGVKQYLWGIKLGGEVHPEADIIFEDKKVGKLTSITATESGYFGLGYIRSKVGKVGLKVQVGEVLGEVVDVPFLSPIPPDWKS